VKKSAGPNGKPQLPTEAELMKMPEGEYMNPTQLAFFKDRLQRMKEELLANADVTSEHLRESDTHPDPADRATVEEAAHVLLELAPVDHYAHFALGRCLEKQGRADEAVGHYRLASFFRPQSRDYRQALAKLQSQHAAQ